MSLVYNVTIGLNHVYFSYSLFLYVFLDEGMSIKPNVPFNFVTHCFFLTHKTLMLGKQAAEIQWFNTYIWPNVVDVKQIKYGAHCWHCVFVF